MTMTLVHERRGSPRREPLRFPAPAGTSVTVWRVDLSDPRWDLAVASSVLNGDERARAARGVPSVRRRRILLRAALRRVLGDVLGVRPGAVPLTVDGGRPYLIGPPAHPAIEFSCSASEDVGLIALADGAPLGVDVQRHRDEDALQAVDEGWLTAAERHALAGLPNADRLWAITRCWTQKEAVLKGSGVGLRREPATIDTPVSAEGRSEGWSLTAVPVPAGFVASVAVQTAGSLPVVHVTPLIPGAAR
jgi:4'-phosphopantetheinyl transferase